LTQISVVRLDETDVQINDIDDADVLLAWDKEADELGAPQNVSSLHALIAMGKRVWYRGGMETVHTAELILGLGCEKVLVGHGFFKTERMPEHFIRRLGTRCLPIVTNDQELEIAVSAGALEVYCEFAPHAVPSGVTAYFS
jgi:hypothetical protein